MYLNQTSFKMSKTKLSIIKKLFAISVLAFFSCVNSKKNMNSIDKYEENKPLISTNNDHSESYKINESKNSDLPNFSIKKEPNSLKKYITNPYVIVGATICSYALFDYFYGNNTSLVNQLAINYSSQLLFSSGIFGIFKGSGIILDQEAERLVDQLYEKDEKGYIKDHKGIEYKIKGNKKVLIIFHGLTGRPNVFAPLIEAGKRKKVKCDIISTLLPFHGRSLNDLNSLNNEEVERFIYERLEYLYDKYDQINIYLKSYSGAVFLSLYKSGKLDKFKDKFKVILDAPNIYNKFNNKTVGNFFRLYGFWRKYCNYECLGFKRDPIAKDQDFRYMVIPAGLKTFEADNNARNIISKLDIPTFVILTKDDKYVPWDLVENEVKNNSCNKVKIKIFESGGHSVLSSCHKSEFIDEVFDFINK